MILFVGGIYLSLRATPDILARLEFAPFILLILIGAPIHTLLNGYVLKQSAQFAGKHMPMRNAVELTLMGSAANLLPIPGAILSKIGGLKAHGVEGAKIAKVLVLTALIWGALSFLWAGGAAILLDAPLVGAIFLAIAGAMGLVTLLLHRGGEGRRPLLNITAVRLLNLPLDAVRFIVLMAIAGVSLNFVEASIFSISGFVATSSMIFPAGLGIYEATVALLSQLVSVEPAVAFLVAVIGRIAYLCGLTLTAILLWLFNRIRPATA
ncbi:hypothetical protein [Sphingomicrobium flavum]|uniref:hypothetical protein n=1 Tax=Sphingomicrobium flavum TaxID=1229164 RepID=UPI0021ADB528|nr:hypothetical protein [Sphingomicrobium flavum]